MIVLSADGDGADLRLTSDEIIMINNALNEVCHSAHIGDFEFQTWLGWNRPTLANLLDQIGTVIRRNSN
jgi:hypothetical protein